ncbi:MAG: hypothetical protein JWM40_2 [Frankiales bacterium]|nr:hypothetical protein [Frankiales bacterium]
MVELVRSYEVLAHPQRRALYDATGRSVHPERVPNTYGRALPFRGGAPALGQTRRAPVRGATVIPTVFAPRSPRWPFYAFAALSVLVMDGVVAAHLLGR